MLRAAESGPSGEIAERAETGLEGFRGLAIAGERRGRLIEPFQGSRQSEAGRRTTGVPFIALL